MARSLIYNTVNRFSAAYKPPSLLVAIRTQSNSPGSLQHEDLSDVTNSDPLLQKLEDAIHRIIVRRSAPDWLPFLPGSSYWVPPPRSRSNGLAQLVEKLANPLTDEETMSTSTVRGCPSSDFFVKGGHPHTIPVETIDSKKACPSEDEEG